MLMMMPSAFGAKTNASITHATFGSTGTGEPVDLYTLKNREGMTATIATYGGIVTTLTAPDRKGHLADVVLGYPALDDYLRASPYFGALIGRYGNRIGGGRFTLDGHVYAVPLNNGPNSLHGGTMGFDKVVWRVSQAQVTEQGPELVLTYLSKDGEEGYPGNLQVTAVYRLTDKRQLRLDYSATTDKATVVNLTQHTYFNLGGVKHIRPVLNNLLQINADQYTPVDKTLIPTGEVREVADSVFDFRTPIAIGARIDMPDEQLLFAKGYDHNWVLNAESGKISLDAIVQDPASGRTLKVYSDQPGLQFYSGNFLDGSITGKEGQRYTVRTGLCLEPQHFPDAPNHQNFSSTLLMPGDVYHSTIIYEFGVAR
jgi:aldose 1-epimerase